MIEDIDYLQENSEKDSMVIYVDSALRNKLFYPGANEYTIQFAQPFRHVYGFEVIDGAIPNTMYNIDVYNNNFYLSTVVKSPTSLIPINEKEEFTHVHMSKTLISLFNADEESHIAIGSETNLSYFVTNSDQTNLGKHYIFYKSSISNIDIAKYKNQSPDTFYIFKFGKTSYAINQSLYPDIVDILKAEEFYLDITNMILYYYEVKKVDANTFSSVKASGGYTVIVNNYRKEISVGNYDILTITNDLSDAVNILSVDVEPTTSPPKKEGKMMFSSTHFLLVNAQKGKLIESLGFDTYPPSQESKSIGNYESWTIGDNIMVYGGTKDPASTTLRYRIISPGLINLLGERFCVLRIKELEDHLYGSYSYMNNTPGIGMFKMAASQGGVTNIRFDYVSLVRKPFHPIGKLDKLTLRFETARGNLYDFKGVNHQLMFVIKYLVPSKKLKFTKSILNPNYDPNIMQYLSNNRSIEYKEDSDDEEEFDEDEYYQTYKKELDRLDYSSTDDESLEDTDSSEEDL